MNLLMWGLTLGTLGKLILGVAVLRVHIRIFQEHRIDGVVLTAIKREHIVTIVGIICILAGYILEVLFYAGSTDLLTCAGSECTSAIDAAFMQLVSY